MHGSPHRNLQSVLSKFRSVLLSVECEPRTNKKHYKIITATVSTSSNTKIHKSALLNFRNNMGKGGGLLRGLVDGV